MILRDILATLDELEVFDRSRGQTPCVLLDGHGSRFGLPFLQYIVEPPHEWCVVIGVPYGTALWQVGDSPEQNGSLNMASVKAKRKIMEDKERMLLNPAIQPYEIMNIVNIAWEESFAKVGSNKNAISERGWLPYNRNLMTYPCLRATMTTEEKGNELLANSKVILPYHKMHDITDLVTVPTFDPKYAIVPYEEQTQIVNFSQGAAAFCLDKLVTQNDLMAARERIRDNRDEGLSMKQKLEKMKQITAGQLFKAKGCRIGKDIFGVHMANIKAEEAKRKENMRNEKDKYTAMQTEATNLLASGVELSKMTNKQLLVLLRPLTRKEDGPMPTVKKVMLERYEQWKNRPLLTFDQVHEAVNNDDSESDDTETTSIALIEEGDTEQEQEQDAASSMMMLSGID